MNDNEGVLWLMVGLVYIITATFAYKGGEMHAEAILKAYKAELPSQMSLLCDECRALR